MLYQVFQEFRRLNLGKHTLEHIHRSQFLSELANIEILVKKNQKQNKPFDVLCIAQFQITKG